MPLDTEAVIAETRSWIGTPYHHQASLKGVGCDCLGLLRGVWRELMGPEPEAVPAYSRDWTEAKGEETLLDAAARHLIEIASAEAEPGDALIFRIRSDAMAKHAGILVAPTRFVHAQEGVGTVEVPLSPWWRRRIAAAFRFPSTGEHPPSPRGEGGAALAATGGATASRPVSAPAVLTKESPPVRLKPATLPVGEGGNLGRSLRRHCERSEAIQGRRGVSPLDCHGLRPRNDAVIQFREMTL